MIEVLVGFATLAVCSQLLDVFHLLGRALRARGVSSASPGTGRVRPSTRSRRRAGRLRGRPLPPRDRGGALQFVRPGPGAGISPALASVSTRRATAGSQPGAVARAAHPPGQASAPTTSHHAKAVGAPD